MSWRWFISYIYIYKFFFFFFFNLGGEGKKKKKTEDYISVDYINAGCIAACGQALILLPSGNTACKLGSPGSLCRQSWRPGDGHWGSHCAHVAPNPSIPTPLSWPWSMSRSPGGAGGSQGSQHPQPMGWAGCWGASAGARSLLHLPDELRQSRARPL